MTISTQNMTAFIQSLNTTLDDASVALDTMKKDHQAKQKKGNATEIQANLDATIALSFMIECNKRYCEILAKIKDNQALGHLIYQKYLSQHKINSQLNDYAEIFYVLNSLIDDDSITDLAKSTEWYGNLQYAVCCVLMAIVSVLAVAAFLVMAWMSLLFYVVYIEPFLPIIMLALCCPLWIASICFSMNGYPEIGLGLLLFTFLLIDLIDLFSLVLVPIVVGLLASSLLTAPLFASSTHGLNKAEEKINNAKELTTAVDENIRFKNAPFFTSPQGDHTPANGQRTSPQKLTQRFFQPALAKEFDVQFNAVQLGL